MTSPNEERRLEDILKDMSELPVGDPEFDHTRADDLLLEAAPPKIRAAYKRIKSESRWWAAS